MKKKKVIIITECNLRHGENEDIQKRSLERRWNGKDQEKIKKMSKMNDHDYRDDYIRL